MSDNKRADAGANGAVSAGSEEAAAGGGKKTVRFSVSRLRADCLKLYGVTQSTFDGAAYGLPDREYSVEEMGDIIKKWGGRPVAAAKKVKKEGS